MRYRFVSPRQTLRSPRTIIIMRAETHTKWQWAKIIGILYVNLVSMQRMALVSAFVTPLARSLWLMTIPPLHPSVLYYMNNSTKTIFFALFPCICSSCCCCCYCCFIFQTNFCLFLHICDVQMCLHVGCWMATYFEYLIL